MRSRGRAGAVDRFGRDLDCGMTSKGHIGSPDIIVDRFGKRYDV